MALATANHRRIGGSTARHRRPGLWQRAVTRILGRSEGKRQPETFMVPVTLPPDATSPGFPVPPRICAGQVAGLAMPISASPHRHRRSR